MNNSMRALLCTMASLTIGMGIGLMIAPATGNETRRKLRYSTGNLKKKIGIGKDEFSHSELEMDATNGRSLGI